MSNSSFLKTVLSRFLKRRDRANETGRERQTRDEVQGALQERVTREDRMAASRRQDRPFAIARPTIPMDNDATSWSGGVPDMPAGSVWPHLQDGDDRTDLHFLLQIDCGALPDDCWDGMGPRSGWLRLFANPFMDETQGGDVIGFWSLDRGVPHAPPSDTAEAEWFQGHPGAHGTSNPIRRTLPRWPLTARPGRSLDEATGVRDSGFIAFNNTGDMNLHDPAMRPVDRASLRTLIDLLRADIDRWQAFPDQWLAGQPDTSPQDRDFLDQFKAEIAPEAAKFAPLADAVLAKLDTAPDFHALVDQFVTDLSGITIPRAGKTISDGPFEITRTPLSEAPPRSLSRWPVDYRTALYEHAKRVYIEQTDQMTPQQRTHFERVWAEDAMLSSITLGAVPRGFAYLDLDEETDTPLDIMLAEIPSSHMQNWMWGDLDNLLIAISPDDLAANRFDRLKACLTN